MIAKQVFFYMQPMSEIETIQSQTVQPALWKQDDCYTFQVFFSE